MERTSSSSHSNNFTTPVERHVAALIEDRLEEWGVALGLLNEFISDQVALLQHTQATMRKHSGNKDLCSIIHSFPAATDQHGHSWLCHLRSYALRSGSLATDQLQMLKGSEEAVQGRLLQTLSDWKARGGEIKGRLQVAQRSINTSHQALYKAMSEHGRVWMDLVGLAEQMNHSNNNGNGYNNGSNSNHIPDRDPWLTEADLRGRIRGYLEAKEAYLTELTHLFNDLRSLEHDLTAQVALPLERFFAAGSQYHLEQSRLAEETHGLLGGIQGGQAWMEALRKGRLDYEWTLEVPPLDGFSQSVLNQVSMEVSLTTQMMRVGTAGSGNLVMTALRSLRVAKAGLLQRPGTLFRSWVPCWVVLSQGGWLHCYEGAGLSKRLGKGANLSSSRKAVREMAMAAAEWYEEATRANGSQQKPLTPAHSMAIWMAGTTVLVEGPKELSFAITVPAQGLFGRSTERRLLLRAMCEEDLVDWCIAIKERIVAGLTGILGATTTPTDQEDLGQRRTDQKDWDRRRRSTHTPWIDQSPEELATLPSPPPPPSESISSAVTPSLDNPWGDDDDGDEMR